VATGQELQDQGVELFKQHDYEAAAQVFQQANDAYLAEGKKDMAAEMQSNLGLIYRSLGENQKALDAIQGALTTFQEMNDTLRSAKALGNLGGVYVAMGDREQAYNCFRQAADIFQDLGEKKLHGDTLLAMADLQMKDGKLMAGAATYEAGLEQIDHLNTSQKIIKGLLNIRGKLMGGGGS
jgi:tetratricopeptide (TPR) repeat protein